MREILHTLTNRNARWRFTHGFFFRFAMGCLGVLFILAFIGILLLINFTPTQ